MNPIGALIAVCMVASSMWLDYHNPRRSAPEQNHYRSITHTSHKEPDPHSPPREGDYQTHTLPITFAVNTLPESSTLTINFKYRIPENSPPLWISMRTKPQTTPVTILMYHPYFQNRPMPYITDGKISLYQKNVTYQTIESFLSSPPESPVFADPLLIRELPPTLQTIPLTKKASATEPEYLLTTYAPPRPFYDWLEFGRVISLSNALKNESGQLIFTITSDENTATIDITPPTAVEELTKPVY